MSKQIAGHWSNSTNVVQPAVSGSEGDVLCISSTKLLFFNSYMRGDYLNMPMHKISQESWFIIPEGGYHPTPAKISRIGVIHIVGHGVWLIWNNHTINTPFIHFNSHIQSIKQNYFCKFFPLSLCFYLCISQCSLNPKTTIPNTLLVRSRQPTTKGHSSFLNVNRLKQRESHLRKLNQLRLTLASINKLLYISTPRFISNWFGIWVEPFTKEILLLAPNAHCIERLRAR